MKRWFQKNLDAKGSALIEFAMTAPLFIGAVVGALALFTAFFIRHAVDEGFARAMDQIRIMHNINGTVTTIGDNRKLICKSIVSSSLGFIKFDCTDLTALSDPDSVLQVYTKSYPNLVAAQAAVLSDNAANAPSAANRDADSTPAGEKAGNVVQYLVTYKYSFNLFMS